MDLDLKRPFGTVYGEGPVHKYEQDDKKFNQEGMWIHNDGTLVTPAEKIEAAKAELAEFQKIKKLQLDRKIRKLEEEERRLEAEAGNLMYAEAAKNIGLLEEPYSFYRSTELIKDALDVVGFTYDSEDGFRELKDHLRKVFDAAGG